MAKIAQETLAEETAQTNPDNTSLMAIVQQLQAEINKLKDQKKSGSNTHKEHYEGPLAYSYKIWDGLPVLNYRSVKKDSTKPFVYKDQGGFYIENHYIELETTEGRQKKPVLLSEFNLNHENSAKMFVTVVTADGEEIKQWGTKHLKRGEVPAKYIFETEEHGTFSVEPKAVN